MSKPVIVCDIDDVLFPFAPGIASFHNARKGTTLTEDDFVTFNFYEVWGGTQEEANVIIEAFMDEDCLDLLPVDGAKEALHLLKNDYDVILVTSRNGIFSEKTINWLTHYLPDLFKDIIFAGNHYDGRGHRTKGEIAKELGATYVIDDLPDNIYSATENGVKGILFGTRGWTLASVNDLPELAVHCRNWQETLEYIYDGNR